MTRQQHGRARWHSHDGRELDRLDAISPARVMAVMRAHLVDHRPLDKLRQGDAFQEDENLPTEISPQLMGQTTPSSLAILVATTTGRVQSFIHSADDISDRDLIRRPRQAISPAGAAHAFDQAVLAQLGK